MTDPTDPAKPQPGASDDVAETDHPTGHEDAARNRDEESPA